MLEIKDVCSLCGWTGIFFKNHNSIRETYLCNKCKSSLRYREQAKMILSKFNKGKNYLTLEDLITSGELEKCTIYEPGIIGPFRKYLSRLPNYTNSYYWPGIQPGEFHNHVRCENLGKLTFSNNVFHLVISSDILEHVRHPIQAFEEIYRILKPGGSHIFTVPILWPLDKKTTARVDTSSEVDKHILKPHYHGSPIDPEGSLVYTDFGMDILTMLASVGFSTEYRGISYNITFCSTKLQKA